MESPPTQERVAEHLRWIDSLTNQTPASRESARRIWGQVAELTGGLAPVPLAQSADSAEEDSGIVYEWFGRDGDGRWTADLLADVREGGGVYWALFTGESFRLAWHAHQATDTPLPPGLAEHFNTIRGA